MRKPDRRSGRRLLCGAAMLALAAGSAAAIDQQYPAAGECVWPSSVQVWIKASPDHPVGYSTESWSKCSGVYVGNHIVLTAAHCIAYMDEVEVHFGEHGDNPAYVDTDTECEAHPDGDWVLVDFVLEDSWLYVGKDIAYCKLGAGHPEPPYAPVMVQNGCEVDYIRDQLFGPGADPFGEPISFVASGGEAAGDNPPIGTKRIGPGNVLFETYSQYLDGLAIVLLQPGHGLDAADIAVRPGDSGGPVMYALPNGTWRVIGLVSQTTQLLYDLDGTGEELRFSVYATSVPRLIPWVESASNNDITPCHSWNGSQWSWQGGPGCGGEFDTSPGTSSSDWPSCSSSTVSFSTACSGWLPPGPGDITTSPSEGDSLLGFLATGPGGLPPGPSFGGKPRLRQIVGTGGDDTLLASPDVGQELFGGRGRDTLRGRLGGDTLHGGVGDDKLEGGGGADVLIPGRGRDSTYGEDGDDTLLVAGTCELAAGEVLDGGKGNDTLHTPVPAAELARLGVRLSNIEKVVLNHPGAQRATCETRGELGPVSSKR